MLMSVLGDAVFFATFIKVGDFVLSLVVPYSLDPTGVYQAAVTPSSVAAIRAIACTGSVVYAGAVRPQCMCAYA